MNFKSLECGAIFKLDNQIFMKSFTKIHPFDDTLWSNATIFPTSKIQTEKDFTYIDIETFVETVAQSAFQYYLDKYLQLAYNVNCEFCNALLKVYKTPIEYPFELGIYTDGAFYVKTVSAKKSSNYTIDSGKYKYPKMHRCPNCNGLLYVK